MKQILLLTVALALLLSGCAAGPAGKDDKAYALRYQPEVGTVSQYDIEFTLEAVREPAAAAEDEEDTKPGKKGETEPVTSTLTVRGTMEERIDGKENEVFKVRRTNEIESATGTGDLEALANTFERQPRETVNLDLDALNRPVEVGAGTSIPLFAPSFPEQGVKVGDTWNATVPADGATRPVQGTFVGVETVDGRETLKLEFLPAGEDAAADVEPTLLWLEPATGRMVRLESNLVEERDGTRVNVRIVWTLRAE